MMFTMKIVRLKWFIIPAAQQELLNFLKRKQLYIVG